jgi:hypothetical protein
MDGQRCGTSYNRARSPSIRQFGGGKEIMKLYGALDRFIPAGRFARAIFGTLGAALFLASGLAIWFLFVFRGFVASVRSSYEPMPVFLQMPAFVALLFLVGLLALAGASLINISFGRPPLTSSSKPKQPLRGSV